MGGRAGVVAAPGDRWRGGTGELHFWQSKEHELDFVLSPGEFLEVKHGRTSPVAFPWFSKVFPKTHLTVISQTRYQTANLTRIGFEEFLPQEG